MEHRFTIYWANAMFSLADRSFNTYCAERLRSSGYDVFLPQEASVNDMNKDSSPTSRDIFRVDTAALIGCDLVVACLDQETIDSGVACEIGIAFAYGIPVIGLYTDIRQFRANNGRMYKNLYVIGAVESAGKIVSDLDHLLLALTQHFETRSSQALLPVQERLSNHFSSVAADYVEFITQLESWYEPKWSSALAVERHLRTISPGSILEIGCGSGETAKHMVENMPEILYVGYDVSPVMTQIAKSQCSHKNVIFTSEWHSVENQEFDCVVISFVLHDYPDLRPMLSKVVKRLKSGGHMIIVDLSTLDLPVITDGLRHRLVRPLRNTDTRLDPQKIMKIASELCMTVMHCELYMMHIRFPSPPALMKYLNFFGIPEGMDLPLGLELGRASEYNVIIEHYVNEINFPLSDQRVFLGCVLRKQE